MTPDTNADVLVFAVQNHDPDAGDQPGEPVRTRVRRCEEQLLIKRSFTRRSSQHRIRTLTRQPHPHRRSVKSRTSGPAEPTQHRHERWRAQRLDRGPSDRRPQDPPDPGQDRHHRRDPGPDRRRRPGVPVQRPRHPHPLGRGARRDPRPAPAGADLGATQEPAAGQRSGHDVRGAGRPCRVVPQAPHQLRLRQPAPPGADGDDHQRAAAGGEVDHDRKPGGRAGTIGPAGGAGRSRPAAADPRLLLSTWRANRA